MKIGLLTSGGDCPGLNAVIRGAVLNGVKKYGYEFVGFRDGWRGVIEGDYMDLPRSEGPRPGSPGAAPSSALPAPTPSTAPTVAPRTSKS